MRKQMMFGEGSGFSGEQTGGKEFLVMFLYVGVSSLLHEP